MGHFEILTIKSPELFIPMKWRSTCKINKSMYSILFFFYLVADLNNHIFIVKFFCKKKKLKKRRIRSLDGDQSTWVVWNKFYLLKMFEYFNYVNFVFTAWWNAYTGTHTQNI